MKFLYGKEWLACLIAVSLFLAFVQYRGFDYDAALYLLQVMHYLQPERFVNDVPFMFGNQDAFSLFSPVIANVFKLLGVRTGGMVATILLQFFFGIAVITLVFKWLKLAGAREWSLPVVLLMFTLLANKEYGPEGFYLPIFESVLDARLFSEVLMTMGLAFLFSKNKYISLAFFVLALLMHPLMGGWALLIWLFICFPKIRMPVIVLVLLSPLSGTLHIGPFDFYSNDWNPVFFRPDWDDSLLYLGLLLFWVAMYRHFRDGAFARFSLNLFWVSLIGFYLQFVGSYMEHIFLFQVQPFRVQWICTIPIIPVFAIFVCDCLKKSENLKLRDYAGLVLGLCAIAACQWFLFLIACSVLLFSAIGNRNEVEIPPSWTRVLFIIGLIFLLVNSVFCNFVQLSIEHGLGNTNLAVSWVRVPSYLAAIERFLLIIFVLVCVLQKKYGCALLFAVAFGCGCLKILPIVGVFFYLFAHLCPSIKNSLLAFSMSFSFFELLGSLYKSNSTEILPFENAIVAGIVLFIILFVVSYWTRIVQNKEYSHNVLVMLFLLFLSLSAWDICRWDSRNEIVALNEKQMDLFFEAPIFPQIIDRGKILFAVDYEAPRQSRINFMTGAYADESIYVGEVFYKEQFVESNRRRSALLTGSPQMIYLGNFSEKMMNVYHNPDTLLSRVHYLCAEGEITHFATDYANMPLPKQDSVYLNVKRKYVWLYGCPK